MIGREALRAYRSRRFDDHTWMKTLPSRDLWAEMRHLKVTPDFKTPPWLHQLVAFYLGLHHPEFLFLMDMGTGKTWVMLNLLQQLIREKKVQRGIVFVPRIINLESWRAAADEHSNLEPDIVNVKGIEEKWDRLENPRGDFTVIDYQGFHLATSKKGKGRSGRTSDDAKLAKMRRRFEFAALDEIHKMGNHQSLWFAQMRQFTRELRYCYGATGTLFSPPNLEPIWSQFYLVDRGDTFGENLGCFRETFFTAEPHPYKGQVLHYNRDATPLLHKMIGHRSIRYDGREVQDLPRCVRRRVGFALVGEQQEQYLMMLERMLNSGDLDPEEREAYWLRLRQITSGYLVWKDELGKHQVNFRENPKLDELERWVDEAGDQKVCISHEYTPSGELIVERLKKMGIKYEWLYGGTKDPVACIQRFKTDPTVKAFVMNSAAGGTGVDGLQRVCRYMLLFESPSSPTARSQLIKRIYRAGQLQRSFVVDFAASRTVDAGILDAVEAGKDLYDSIMQGRLTNALLGG